MMEGIIEFPRYRDCITEQLAGTVENLVLNSKLFVAEIEDLCRSTLREEEDIILSLPSYKVVEEEEEEEED